MKPTPANDELNHIVMLKSKIGTLQHFVLQDVFTDRFCTGYSGNLERSQFKPALDAQRYVQIFFKINSTPLRLCLKLQ